jgi:hypothetical protein
MATFYDNTTDHIAVADSSVAFERVYCIRFADLTEQHLLELDRLYRRLPGWVDYLEGIPHWFGQPESIPSLSASAEPSGLIVSGTAPAAEWEVWDFEFRRGIAEFPMFEV